LIALICDAAHRGCTNVGLRCANPTYKTNATLPASSSRQDFSSTLNCCTRQQAAALRLDGSALQSRITANGKKRKPSPGFASASRRRISRKRKMPSCGSLAIEAHFFSHGFHEKSCTCGKQNTIAFAKGIKSSPLPHT
jgi:hypothetical protein